jgi:membrane protease YdiL (CAAX protease family)
MSAISSLFHNPYILGAYSTLILALISCWVLKKYYVFAPLYVIAYAFAYMGQIVSYLSLFPLTIILLCIFALKFHLKRFLHLFASLTLAIVGVGIMTHMIVGFNNFPLVSNQTFGSSKTAINLYLNFDKLSLAVLLLGLFVPLVKSKEEWKHTCLIAIPYLAFTAFILIGYGLSTNLLALDIKIPSLTIVFLIVNLFFVVIPEEAFYRGFLQNEITKNLPNKAGPILAILVVSSLFGLIHIFFISNLSYIVATFIGSVLYGTIYQFSKSVESAMITHFGVNVIHFFFFTYPINA